MTYAVLKNNIFKFIKSNPTVIRYYEDGLSLVLSIFEENRALGLEYSQELKQLCLQALYSNNPIKAEIDLIYRKILLLEAPYLFDSYLLYLEINRRPREKFYAPRRARLFSAVQELQNLEDGSLDELFVSMPPRVGKAQPLDAEILTPNGFVRMGDIKIGDYVMSPNGKPTKVVGVFPQGVMDVYQVSFSDGTSCECTENHLWTVKTRDDRHRGGQRTIELKEMMKNLKVENGKRYNYSIQYTSPIQFEKKDLPIHPYVLGVILGDGNFSGRNAVSITNCERDILDKIKTKETDSEFTERYDERCHTICMTFVNSTIKDRMRELQLYGKDGIDKFIPEIYLRSSVEDRIELLKGLLDSDGYVHKHLGISLEFTTISESLKNGVLDLVRSLGGRITFTKKQGSYKYGDTRRLTHSYYRMVISFANGIIPVSSEKHLSRINYKKRMQYKFITNIEYKRFAYCQCIKVENNDGLYITNDYIVTHNTTLLMFFLTWIAGKYPEISNLYSAYSDVITSAMFEGVLEVLQDSTTYTWHEIFPETKLVHTDAKDETLDFGRRKRYPTITCRSLYGTLNGACDCQGYLISDDLIGGIEEALNKDRLTSAWYKVDNNLIPRAKENAKILWLGTRWSIVDPAGKRMDLLMNSPEYKHRRFKILSMPALDPLTDESNFDYKFGVGFSTAFYRQRRASFERQDDMASWFAQYQNEPIERDGALFSPGNMKFYNGVLPEEEPDTVRMACDVAFGGGDFLSAPVAYVYGNDVYIADVVFDSSDKKITQPLVVDAICRNKVKKAQFEANNGGDEYANKIDEKVRLTEHRCTITSKKAPTSKRKEDRIFDAAPEIREWYFLEEGKRSPMYSKFMTNLYSFKIMGKNKHDDAPDSCAMLNDLITNKGVASVEVVARPV